MKLLKSLKSIKSMIKIAVLTTALLMAISVFASFPGANGLIAFASNRTGHYEIYTMNPDGSNVVQLTNFSVVTITPSWSADGMKIAFSTNKDGNYEIYTMDANGGNLTRLTNNPATDQTPSWSPDSRKIVFKSNRGTEAIPEVFTMNADSTHVQQLTHNLNITAATRIYYSPDGTKLMFSALNASQTDNALYIMNPDGTNIQPYTALGVGLEAWDSDWSPNGKNVVFADFAVSDISNIFIGKYFKNQNPLIPITSRTQLKQITPDASGNNWQVNYSPDGKYLVILRQPGVTASTATLNDDLYITRINDPYHVLVNITNSATPTSTNRYPSWQPLPKHDGDNNQDDN